MLRIALASMIVFGVGCKKEAAPKPKATASTSTGTVANGVRSVPIEVVKDGYSPDRIPGKPGEKLELVFTRKVDGECYEELIAPDGSKHKLEKNKPTAIAVTVPMDGEVKFTCGMDMFRGVIIAEKS